MTKSFLPKSSQSVKQSKKSADSTNNHPIKIDRSFKRFKEDVAELSDVELARILNKLTHIGQMTWNMLNSQTSKTLGESGGLNWKPIKNQATAQGNQIHSLRLSKAIRARAFRDSAWMVFLSLHTDHDSVYDEPGGEDVTGHPPKPQTSPAHLPSPAASKRRHLSRTVDISKLTIGTRGRSGCAYFQTG